MDRQIVYPGQIPLETDLLATNRNTMIALGKLIGAVLGTANVVNGLAVTPTTPASLSVNVGLGEIYSLQNVDNTAYSSIAADTTDAIVKQGIQLGTKNLACAAPSTTGFSINYLIEAAYEDSDTGDVLLPYYNASNPQSAYAGPGNNGVQQSTVRQGLVSLVAKPGIAALTGTQTNPSVDSGYTALAVVTVAYGQTTIVSGNIAAVTSSQVLTQSLLAQVIAAQNPSGRLLGVTIFSSSGTFTPNPLARTTVVRGAGGGGSGGNSSNTGAGQVSLAGGGMCGACGEALFVGALSGPVTVTIGAGGAPSVALGAAGTAGASTTFGSLLTLPGGNPGAGGAAVTAPATVEASGASVVLPTTTGTFLWSTGTSNTNSRSVAISSAVYWGANGTACPFGFGNSGHGSGGSGNAVGPSASGVAGTAGNSGLIIVEEYA